MDFDIAETIEERWNSADAVVLGELIAVGEGLRLMKSDEEIRGTYYAYTIRVQKVFRDSGVGLDEGKAVEFHTLGNPEGAIDKVDGDIVGTRVLVALDRYDDELNESGYVAVDHQGEVIEPLFGPFYDYVWFESSGEPQSFYMDSGSLPSSWNEPSSLADLIPDDLIFDE